MEFTRLNSFTFQERTQALLDLNILEKSGVLQVAEQKEVANMHCHSFFSYSGFGHSPTSLAWLAKQNGYKLMGLVDANVLDGVDEFLDACELLGVRGGAGIEVRTFIPTFAGREINSPGEPGAYYHMGIGFTSTAVPDNVKNVLNKLTHIMISRNLKMLDMINAFLDPVKVDYEKDVLPLTPGGNATERHLVQAYVNVAERHMPDPGVFWAAVLGLSPEEIGTLMKDSPAFQGKIRARLMKNGGIGYLPPDPSSYLTVEEFHHMVVSCGAIPCGTWLDGTSAGETAIEELLDYLVGEGVAALNIIPDRNWNIRDSDVRAIKLKHLYKVVDLAEKYSLPLIVGTEMNSPEQKLVDDFAAPELEPVKEAFIFGAYFAFGHTALQRALGIGYQSQWARLHLPAQRERNDFYSQCGRLAPAYNTCDELRKVIHVDMSPPRILRELQGCYIRMEGLMNEQ